MLYVRILQLADGLSAFVNLAEFSNDQYDWLDVRNNLLHEDVCDQISLLDDRFTQHDADFYYDPQGGYFLPPPLDWWPQYDVIDLIFGTNVDEYSLICE